jgi:hypothetical protein
MMRTLPIMCLLILCAICATACGVRVQVATPPVPTLTPRAFPDIDYSRGGVWRVQAAPHIIFTDEQTTQVQLFMQTDQPDIFTIQNRPLWIVADYDVTWFAAPQSNVQVRLSVYTRPTTEDSWEIYDTAERNLTTTSAPINQAESLVVTIYPEDTGSQDVRAEVSVVAYTQQGEISTNVNANELQIHVLGDLEDLEADTDSLRPALDAPDWLWDWRGWRGGPCAFTDWGIDDIDEACKALDEGNLEATAAALQTAVTQAGDDDLKAGLFAQLGLVKAAQQDYKDAAAQFSQSIDAYTTTADTLQVGIQLYNLTSAQYAQEDEVSYVTLNQLNDLRSLFYDEAGNMLAQGTGGLMIGEDWRMDEALSFFRDRELPQADLIQSWLDRPD